MTENLRYTDRVDRLRSERAVGEGKLVAVRRGVHASDAWWRALRPHERYRRRVQAAARRFDDPVLAYESAALLWDLPVFGEPRDIHLFHTGKGHSYRFGDVLVHASTERRTFERVSGVRVTTLLDTVVDLIRVLPFGHGVAVVDAALRKGLTKEALRARLAEQPNRRGSRAAHAAIDFGDGRAESPLESVSRVVIVLLGYEPPELQVEFVVDGELRRVDFWWLSVRVVGEADGNTKYLDVDAGESAARLRDERRRENALQLTAGRVTRWEWTDATTVDPLDRILAAAGVPRVRAVDPALFRAFRNSRSLPRD